MLRVIPNIPSRTFDHGPVPDVSPFQADASFCDLTAKLSLTPQAHPTDWLNIHEINAHLTRSRMLPSIRPNSRAPPNVQVLNSFRLFRIGGRGSQIMIERRAEGDEAVDYLKPRD